MKKTILIIIIIAAFLSLGVYWFLFRKKEPNLVFYKVARGAIVEQVSETGSVKVSEKRELSFKNSGRIEKVYVKVGDSVFAGQSLAKLDTREDYLRLEEAKASLKTAKANRADAEVSLENAEQSLKDAEAKAKENLDNAYSDALTVLDDCYLEAYKSYNLVYKIQHDYFTSFDKKSREVIEEKYSIESNVEKIKSYLVNAKSNSGKESIDLALSKTKEKLELISDSLEAVREATKDKTYQDIVAAADKTSLETGLLNIDTKISNAVNAEQAISTAKIDNKVNINNAKAKKISLENKLGEGNLYEAEIEQARAKINLLEDKIAEAIIKAPENGKIIAVDKREGETVQPAMSVISFLPAASFQVEVNIYEEDVVKVKIGDPVDINLTSFPNKTLKGKVVSIDPAEKLIEGVVYYKVTIDFLETEKGIKPGMTADITIRTAKKENVLRVPKESVEKLKGREIVKVYEGGKIQERTIKTGLKGEDFIEIISGLKEGEEIL